MPQPSLSSARAVPTASGRYVLYEEIAAGGMASVHLGRLLGPAGFSRTVAIKRLHPHLAKDPAFVAMFVDEARMAARIRHPNVVSTVDVASNEGELLIVMDYVHGESLARLLRAAVERGEAAPAPIVASVMTQVLYGLHAAHEASGESGKCLELVHRDVSPQNILVGLDGVARVVDFGIAKAFGRLQTTTDGQVKGKAAYMSPEQLLQEHVDRRTDVFAASVTLWEALTGRRLYAADNPTAVAVKVLSDVVPPPSAVRAELTPSLDEIVLRGLSRRANDRFATAREMALALEEAIRPASPAAVGDWVKLCAGDALERRARSIADAEQATADGSAGGSSVRLAHSSDPGGGLALAEGIRARAAAPTIPTDVDARQGSSSSASAKPAVTDATLVTPATSDRIARQRWRLPLALVVGGVFIAALIGLRGSPRGPSTAAVVSPPSQAAVESASSSTTASASLAEGPAFAATVAPSVSAAVVPPPRSTKRAPAATERSKPASRPKTDCDPPFVWDAERRIRVYKKECE